MGNTGVGSVLLSALESDDVLQGVILPTATKNAVRQDQPVVVIVGGQPGAGKTWISDLVQAALDRRGGAVRIGRDLYKAAHSRYAELLADDVRTAACAGTAGHKPLAGRGRGPCPNARVRRGGRVRPRRLRGVPHVGDRVPADAPPDRGGGGGNSGGPEPAWAPGPVPLRSAVRVVGEPRRLREGHAADPGGHRGREAGRPHHRRAARRDGAV